MFWMGESLQVAEESIRISGFGSAFVLFKRENVILCKFVQSDTSMTQCMDTSSVTIFSERLPKVSIELDTFQQNKMLFRQ